MCGSQAEHERDLIELREQEARSRAQWEQERSQLSADLAEKAALLEEASQTAAALQARVLETETALGTSRWHVLSAFVNLPAESTSVPAWASAFKHH